MKRKDSVLDFALSYSNFNNFSEIVFENNLETIKPPVIKRSTVKPYTKVSWLPDYERFGIEKLFKI